MRRHLSTIRVLTASLATLALLAACTGTSGPPAPTTAPDSPERAAAQLANGLAQSDLTTVEFAGASSADINAAFKTEVNGMGPLRPDVGVAALNAQPDTATATLRFTWTFPGVPSAWTYDTTADLRKEAGRWKTAWSPTIVQGGLDQARRLTQHRLYPKRGQLLGQDGIPLVSLRPVVRIGIDKTALSAQKVATSARRLAALLKIDAKAYAAKVAAAGAQAFVEAIVLRATASERPANQTVSAIPGALAIEDQQMLTPDRNFARALIGTVGDASKEIVDSSGGAVVAGDQVGLSGLQRRYDAVMRGTPGVLVQLVPARPTASSSSASPIPSAAPSPRPAQTVFDVRPAAGADLTTTLNLLLQHRAEGILAGVKPASAIVAIRPSTGAIVAAANGPGSGGQATATVGQFAPGSTFKVATTLALLRAGLKPTSTIPCPATVTVDGKRFKNYSDYPSSQLGTIPLRTALAQSCNTAFIGQRGQLKAGALAQAAGSLGLGIDYDVGFPAFFGSVPDDTTKTGQAAAMIGQGKVLASPLAMAAVAASVEAGRSVVPHLLAGQVAKSTAMPLTSAEAQQLRSMMQAVVTEGSGRFLQSQAGPTIIAKTGTAEYGTKAPFRTHAWMIAAQGDLAVAAFVNDGQSGSHTAGPLLAAFLQAAR